jgi:hypothetical protein
LPDVRSQVELGKSRPPLGTERGTTASHVAQPLSQAHVVAVVEGLDVPLGHIEVAFPLKEGPCGGQPAPEGAFPRGQSAACLGAGSRYRVTSQLGEESELPGVQVINVGTLSPEPLPRVRRPGFVRALARGVVGPLPGDRPGRVPPRVQGREGSCPFCGEAAGAGALGRQPAPEGIVVVDLVDGAARWP